MREQFRITSERLDDGSFGRFQWVHCSRCDKPGKLRDSSRKTLPVEMVSAKFRQQGWSIGPRPGGDLCPKCAGNKTPAQKRAAWCAINLPKSDKPKEVTVTNTAPKADPPRIATVADRRHVLEALEEHYDVKGGRYIQNWSDKGLAAKLSVPAAWIAKVREELFGPDVNEAAAMRDDALKSIEQRFTEFEDATLQGLDDIRQELKKMKVEASYAA